MKKIVVTGASGLVGFPALAALAGRGFDVHAVSRAPFENENCTSHAADLLDHNQLDAVIRAVRPTHLLHLAWVTTPGQFWNDELNLAWVEASLHLFRSFKENGGQRFVGAGTCAEYDWSASPFDEYLSPCVPRGLYGASKLDLFRALTAAAGTDNFSFAWGRLFFLYGPRERPGRLVSDTIHALLSGKPMATGAGNEIRDYMYALDAADAFAALCDSNVQGPVNIGSGTGTRIRDLVGEIGRLIGRPELIELAARPTPPDQPAELVPITRRLNDEAGYRPTRDLETGLQETIGWWRTQLR